MFEVNEKLLAILIPTYNRKVNLMINLRMLSDHIDKLDCYSDVKIIVSDNCGVDGTYTEVQGFFSTVKVDYSLFKQEHNLGLEKNAIFCLEKSNAKYSMYLGDDDYINIKYLEKVLSYLKKDESITCIIPNCYAIDNTFNKIGETRDQVKTDQSYLPIDDRLDLMFKAHQLSGLVLKTEGTLKSYLSNKGNNIYLFMYFAAFNIKRGRTIHISNLPVQVTDTNSKDWTYGNDGLITEIIQNILMIARTEKERFELEKIFLKENKWRYLKYSKRPLPFLKIVFTSERYSVKLRWYIVWRLIVDNILKTPKTAIKAVMKLFGFEIKQRRIIQRK